MFRRKILLGMTLASVLAIGAAQAKTIRIAEHRQARIDALKTVVPDIEKKYNVKIEVVEYPAPEKDYLTKLLTELGAGNAPDIFNVPHASDIADVVAAGYPAPAARPESLWRGLHAHLAELFAGVSIADLAGREQGARAAALFADVLI